MKLPRRLKTSSHRFWYKNFSRTSYKIKKFMGAEFFICPDHYIDRRIWVEGGYEKQQLFFFTGYARKISFDMFIDIGANFGLYSCILAANKLVPKIHSFECDPRNLYHLYGHIRMNNVFDAITVHPYALGATEGEISFSPAPDDNAGKSRVQKDGSISVQQKALDQVLDLQDKKLLIKIDVEGYEGEVLKGMTHLLQNNQALIQVERLEENPGFLDEITKLGYKKIHQIENDVYFSNMKEEL